jgi:hypothetical protein
MKTTKYLLLALLACKVLTASYAHADEDMVFPTDEETISPSSSSSAPPVIIDESDSSDVSDVEEYDG